MSPKTVFGIIVVIIILAIAGYYMFLLSTTPSEEITTPTVTSTTTAPATSTSTPPTLSTPTTTAPNKPPIANAMVSKFFVSLGEEVVFNAEMSYDPDGKIVKYLWDFGDGTTGEGVKVTHKYSLPGKYIVTLTVVDDRGASDTNEENLLFVTVEFGVIEASPKSPPVPVISADKDVALVGEAIEFDGSSSWAWVEVEGEVKKSTDAIVKYLWDFGDGTTGEGKRVNHTFTTPGSYVVKLTVVGKNSKEATIAKTIKVVAKGEEVAIKVKNPDTIVVARIGEPETVDPAYAHSTASGEIIDNVYERLVWTTVDYREIKPWLAERWEVSEDGLTYTFYIRKGVKFHDGTELTAEDVEYSFERLLVLDLPQGHVRMIKPFLTGGVWDPDVIDQAVEAVDKYTVVFHLKKPFAPFLRVLASDYAFVIISKKWAIEHGDWDPSLPKEKWKEFRGKVNDYIMRHAMGTGPYKLVEWIPGQRIVLERFDNYWRGPAKVKKVVIMPIPELSTRVLMLKSGDVDVADIPFTYRPQLEGVEGITIYSGAATNVVEFIQFCLNISKIPEGDTIWSDFFTDPDVRKGFAYAFPYEEFIQKAYLGLAVRARACVPPGWMGYVEAYTYNYNPEKAKEHLMRAWGGKVWEEGFILTAYYNAGNDQRRIALELLAESLAKINPKFKIRIQALDWPVYLDKMDNFELPLYAIGDWINYLDPHIAVEQQLTSYSLFQALGGGYKNPWVDEMVKKAVTETDPKKREEIYMEIQRKVLGEDVPMIYTVYPSNFVVMRSWIKGYYYNPFYGGLYYYALSKG